jgi:hypothetical protein
MLRAVIYQSDGVAKAGRPDFHSPTHDRQHAWQDPVLTMTCPLTIKTGDHRRPNRLRKTLWLTIN